MAVSPVTDEAAHGALKKLWQMWKRLGQFMADVTARVALTIFYFTLFLPFGVYVTMFRDPLHVRREPALPTWLVRHHKGGSVDDARRQF